LIGPDAWSRIIRIENTNRRSAYPRVVLALVFEFGGILWFYTDADGTQSFSMRKNNLRAEEADFHPLLRDIERGFVDYTIVPEETAAANPTQTGPLPNGCFEESVAELRRLTALNPLVESARLLSYYVRGVSGWLGHTVLSYETPDGKFVFDPLEPRSRRVHPKSDDPLSIAQGLRHDLNIAKARWVPTARSTAVTLVASNGPSTRTPRG